MKNSVLIINSNSYSAQDIKRNLSSAGNEIICVADMTEALFLLKKFEFCLIILDASISAEDDHRLLSAIRKSKPLPF